eukprot:TRINITY_DN5362_c0_g1_i2.p1 TRINITY_DN5362_c0_g1~~TRINITY_DN5362_c0_g1_i2.p1  ORF type:complete len:238 (-),score=47.49 TRINITY_DN5362_c0_g1_i2:45-758(-)
MYNGPRAGICFDDGFIGGDVIQSNLLFNLVRETGDHGPFNSWDRVPYIWSPDRYNVYINVETHTISNNFIMNRNFLGGTYGTRCLDHDDGSNSYYDAENVLLYGSVKFRDGCNRTATNNLILVDSTVGSEMQFLCPFNVTTEEYFTENTVISYVQDAPFYECVGLTENNITMPFISLNNQYFTPGQTSLPFTTQACSPANDTTLSQWQELGFDINSTISENIDLAAILSLAKALISL